MVRHFGFTFLREAKILGQDGEHLGPVGSTILFGVFYGGRVAQQISLPKQYCFGSDQFIIFP